MASISLSLCSSFTTLSNSLLRQKTTLSLSKTKLNFLSPTPFSSHRLTSSLTPSPRQLASSSIVFVPKFSETDTITEAETQPDAEPSPVVEIETTTEEEEPPKREEVFAVVMIGSRQYIVFPGRFIYTQRFKGANVNDKIILNKVLLVGTKTSTYIGKPVVPNAAVHAVVEEQGLNDKVIVFKYKKKKKYRRNIGHRQPNSRIRIMSITGYEDTPAVTLP